MVEYYHIELESHDAVFAEGAAAETYYDASNRAGFHNTRPGSAAGGEKSPFAPVLSGGGLVERVWRRLFARTAGEIASDTTDDPDLHLLVDGRRLDRVAAEGCTDTFLLTMPPAGALAICSRSGAPSLLGISAHDHRRLGVALTGIELRQPGVATTFEYDFPLFVEAGCHPAESDYVWTDGELELPAHLFTHLKGAFTLTMHIERPGMRYPLQPIAIKAVA